MSPYDTVTVMGCVITLMLMFISIMIRDKMPFLATLFLSLLSTVAGMANRCDLELFHLPKLEKQRPGDTVIRYPNGGFIVVKCDEDVAYELFFGPHAQLEYKFDKDKVTHGCLSLVGTIFLMLGIIFLANSMHTLQLMWLVHFIIVNLFYWVISPLQPRLAWDFPGYDLDEIDVAYSYSFDSAL